MTTGSDGTAIVREATEDDLPAIVRLLADDPLGITRESGDGPLAESYRDAFAAIQASPHNTLFVLDRVGEVVGCMQLTLIPGVGRRGMWRGQIENVRIASSLRGQKLGEFMMHVAIKRCRDAGCGLVQLTTDTRRLDAHRFYERLGFVGSHVGMKLALD